MTGTNIAGPIRTLYRCASFSAEVPVLTLQNQIKNHRYINLLLWI